MRKHSLVFLTALLVSVMSLAASPVAAQTAYTSPTYGFSISLPAGWTVDSESSDGSTDVLRFSNDDVVAFLTSYATDETPAECIDAMVSTIEERPNHDNFAFAVPVAEQPGVATATFGYTFITAVGEELTGRDRMTCQVIDGGMVRLEFLVLERDLAAQEAAIQEVEEIVAAAVQPLAPAGTPAVVPATPLTGEETDETESTATSAATVTAVPEPTEEPDVAAEASPEVPTAQATVELTPTEEAALPEDAIVSPNITGNSYVSPGFGYGLTWSDVWMVTGEESDTRGDYLGLEYEGGVFADLIGEPFPADTGSCFDFIVNYYTNHDDYSNVVGTMDPVSAAPGLWDYTGVLTVTTVTDSDSSLDLVNYLSCSHVPGQSAIVSLEQVVLPETFEQLKPEMDALRQGFVSTTGAQTTTVVEASPTPSPETTTATTTPTSSAGGSTEGTVIASSVVGNAYTSPTFGYTLTWDDTWIVDQERADGKDYLSLENGAVYAELLSEEWDSTQGNCFEWIVDFYETNPDYSNVRASQDANSAAPGVWDITGAIAMSAADGSEERINYVACSEVPGQNAIVSLEQFVFPMDAPGQLAAMDALREGFSIS